MKEHSLKKMWWWVIALYLAVIYSTLALAPKVWDGLDAAFGGKGIVLLYLVAIAGVLMLLGYMFFRREYRKLDKYLIVLVVGCVFFELNMFAVRPVEKIHLLEYGILGALAYNALRTHFDRYDMRLYLSGALLCSLAGLVDEVIQLFLPSRVFDWRDVAMNAISGILVLILIRSVILKPPANVAKLHTQNPLQPGAGDGRIKRFPGG